MCKMETLTYKLQSQDKNSIRKLLEVMYTSPVREAWGRRLQVATAYLPPLHPALSENFFSIRIWTAHLESRQFP